jgi:hypothetical protein
MSFMLWRSRRKRGYCVLSPTNIEDVARLHAGETVPADFGQPIQYRMSDDFPDDIALGDNYAVADQIVISSRLRGALQPLLPPERFQFLPARIINHKGRVAADDYTILHPHDICDCIDLQASNVTWNALNKQRIFGCDSLVIDPRKVGDDLLVFRLKHWGAKILIRDSLAGPLKAQGFVGLDFIDPAGYMGVG